MAGEGLLRRLPGGIFVASHVPDTTALRAAAVLLALEAPVAGRRLPAGVVGPAAPSRAVVGFRTAAWVHAGGPVTDDLDLVIAPGSARPRRPGLRLHEHRLHPRDTEQLGGLRLTTPVRTAADLARGLPGEQALAALEALRTACGVRVIDVLEQLELLAGGRGVARARDLVHAWAGELASGTLG